jgi:hypothetical protein
LPDNTGYGTFSQFKVALFRREPFEEIWVMPVTQTVVGTIILGIIAGVIVVFIQKGFLDPHVFRDDADRAAEQARTAEALRQQEAAARASAEAVAERIKRTAIEDENRRMLQAAAAKAKADAAAEQLRQDALREEIRRARIQADIDAQRRRQQDADQAQRAAIEKANRLRAYRAANGGCDLGSHRVCVNVGPTGGGGGGYQAGCVCVGD